MFLYFCNLFTFLFYYLYIFYILGNKFIQKWKNIKDNYTKSVKKKSKSGQAAEVGKRYIYARQLSFLQTAGATTETQSSLDGELEEPSESEQLISQEESETPPTYTQNSTKKRKRDIETSLIDFINAPIPSSTVPPVSEINPDKSFFESVLPSISNFTEDQKLEFRCEVLNIIKRMRNPPITQNYGYSPGIPYYKPTHDPSYPIAHHSNYLNRPQFPIHSQTRQPTPLSQPQNPNMIFKPISPSSSSSTTIDNQTFTEEDSLDIFRDGI